MVELLSSEVGTVEVVNLAERGEHLRLALQGLSRAHQTNILIAAAAFRTEDPRYATALERMDGQPDEQTSHHLAEAHAAFTAAYGSPAGEADADWLLFLQQYGGGANQAQRDRYAKSL